MVILGTETEEALLKEAEEMAIQEEQIRLHRAEQVHKKCIKLNLQNSIIMTTSAVEKNKG